MKLLRGSKMPCQVDWVYKTSVFVVAQSDGNKKPCRGEPTERLEVSLLKELICLCEPNHITALHWHEVLTIFKLVTFIRKSSSGCPAEVVVFFSLFAVTAPVTVTLWFRCFGRSTVELLSP